MTIHLSNVQIEGKNYTKYQYMNGTVPEYFIFDPTDPERRIIEKNGIKYTYDKELENKRTG